MNWEDFICVGCLYAIEDDGVYAVARLSKHGGMTVLAGSHFVNRCDEDACGIVNFFRRFPIRSGNLVLEGGTYRFVRDYEFKDGTSAAVAILGTRIAACYAWKRK